MKSEISLDLVICTYNNAALLDRTLEAISRQRASPAVDWRVLVVDNNCTDETPAVVARHAASMPIPLRRVCEPRQGLTPARVCGAHNTSGDWLAFIDDDCLLAEDWVDQAAGFALEHPTCGAFGGRVLIEWEEKPPAYLAGYGYAYAETDLGETVQRRDWLAGAGMVLRRAALEDTGWLERQYLEDRVGHRLVSGGDIEVALRIAAQFEIWYHPGCTLRHVIPTHRVTRPYLRRLLFGLGASAHAAGALAWRGSHAGWWLHAARTSGGHLAQGVRRVLDDARYRRSALDVGIAFDFVLGWWNSMWRMVWTDPARRAISALHRVRVGEASRSGARERV